MKEEKNIKIKSYSRELYVNKNLKISYKTIPVLKAI